MILSGPTRPGLGIMPGLDLETFSLAGYHWDGKKFGPVPNCPKTKTGLNLVSAARYSEDVTTEILLAAYTLPDDLENPRSWRVGDPPPDDLFQYLAQGGKLAAWNSFFEFQNIKNVAFKRMGWPFIPLRSFIDTMAVARYNGLPGGLGDVGRIMQLEHQKDKRGDALITKFSKPKNPTKTDPGRMRILPSDDPEAFNDYAHYNVYDVKTETSAQKVLEPLPPDELETFFIDQEINERGVAIDLEAIDALQLIVNAFSDERVAELRNLTDGEVLTGNQLKAMKAYLADKCDVNLPDMTGDTVDEAVESLRSIESILPNGLPVHKKRALDILVTRQAVAGASVKKLAAMRAMVCSDGTLKGLFAYYGAERTGRFAGRGPQPQNLQAWGPDVVECCDGYYAASLKSCPHCGRSTTKDKTREWNYLAAEFAIRVAIKFGRAEFEKLFPDVIGTIGGCLRSLFVARKGHRFICSDYSAIEAVVLAFMAGEQWRMDVFNTHGKIYEMTAAKLSGIPFQEFLDHKKRTDSHLPERKKYGKVPELASGYKGWVTAWKAFGAEKYFDSDKAIKREILKWRDDSPMIGKFWEGIESAAVSAMQNRGIRYEFRGVTYEYDGAVLKCWLPSGRRIVYRSPWLTMTTDRFTGQPKPQINFMGWNADSTKGKIGWRAFETYDGKLTENVIQAIARDILTYAFKNLRAAGYHIVMHVHDEIVVEAPDGHGSLEEVERIMSTMPPWCADWPVRARDGWVGHRFRKD